MIDAVWYPCNGLKVEHSLLLYVTTNAVDFLLFMKYCNKFFFSTDRNSTFEDGQRYEDKQHSNERIIMNADEEA